MDIRVAEEADVDRMMEVYADGRAALAALGIDQWQGGYPERWRVEADVARRETRVACDDDGRIIGCAMISCQGDPDYDSIDGAWLAPAPSDAPTYAVVHRVATAAEARGKGAAQALFAEAEHVARAAGCKSVRVDTHHGNVPMQRLIGKMGFTPCGDVVVSCVGDGATPVRIAFEKLL